MQDYCWEVSIKLTLLEMTQDILNDTTESTQVAQIIKTTFFSLMSIRNWRSNHQLLALVASANNSLPTHMYLPENLSELTLINYDAHRDGQNRKIYKSIKFLYPDEFLRRQNALNTEADNVDIILDPTGVELLIRNDIPPTYWTSFDDNAIVFDSYDKLVDDTLQESKCQAMGYLTPTWSHVDDFVPPIPMEDFTYLLEEAKSRASLKLKQVPDQKAEQTAQTQKRWLSRKQWRAHGGIRYPNYGRRGNK